MHIGIVARLDIPKSVELVKEMVKFLLNKEIQISIDNDLTQEIPELKKMGVELQNMEVDMIIAIGGDGTILRTQSFVNGKKIPIF
ncbi:MAG TPA: NAD(+)/NADH kinase, partial [Methanobacteriaceae archaeon]|nr:NAD(+)/NADH kinase [Methanobacteriaceae archaeon]